jgi:hypothetical protein
MKGASVNKRAHTAKPVDARDDDDTISKEVLLLAPLTVDETEDDASTPRAEVHLSSQES